MVEIVEYLIVFGITAALAGLSVTVIGGFLPAIGHAQAQTELDQIAGAADVALARGNSSLVLPLTDASLSCTGGVILLSTGGREYTSEIGAACGFSVDGLNGVCQLAFTREHDGLHLEVAT